MSRRAYLYFALTFLLGAIIGGACVYYYGWSTGHWHRPFNRRSFISRLKSELDLSDKQVQELEQIVDDSTGKVQSAQRQADSLLNAVREETRGRIRQILSPEQNQKFDELTRRWDERRKRSSH